MKILFLFLLFTVFAANGKNYFVNGSFEYGKQSCFNRMAANSYTFRNKWVLDDTTKVHGRYSLRGKGGDWLKLSTECNDVLPGKNTPFVFSFYAKADRPVQLRTALIFHNNETVVPQKKSFKLTTGWKRYTVLLKRDPVRNMRRIGRIQGPVDFELRVPDGATVWLDALQYEKGSVPGDYRESEMNYPADRSKLTLPEQTAFAVTPAETGIDSGKTVLYVWNDGKNLRRSAAVSLGVPFTSGTVGSRTNFRLTDKKGRAVPVQTLALAARVKDASVIASAVDFSADLEPGRNEFVLEYGKNLPVQKNDCAPLYNVLPGKDLLWKKIVSPNGKILSADARVFAADLSGVSYRMAVESVVTERPGPLHRVVCHKGAMVHPEDESKVLVNFEARVHTYALTGKADVELTVINYHPENPVVLREFGWMCSVPEKAASVSAVKTASCRLKKFYGNAPDTQVDFAVSGTPVRVRLDMAEEYHPSKVSVGGGRAKWIVWDKSYHPLILSSGISVTRRGSIAFGSEAAFSRDVVSCVSPDAFARACVPFALSGKAETPFLDAYLKKSDSSRHSVSSVKEKFSYGLFDFGDHRGDGGWANMESYEDYTTLMRAVIYSDPELLRQGFAAARHYRDVDINHNSNLAMEHSCNHIVGGFHSGHSWTQGIMLHYLLTGDFRSREVAVRNLKRMMAIPPDAPDIDGDRRLGYWMLTMTDGARMLGSKDAPARLEKQLKYATEQLKRKPDAKAQLMQRTTRNFENSIFYWNNSGFVPFGALYGVAGLLGMYETTGNKLFLKAASVDVENLVDLSLTYREHLEETYPGLPPEKTLPLAGCDYFGGRGSYVYPVLSSYSAATGDPRYNQLAVRMAYARILEGNTNNNSSDILMTSALARMPENFDEESVINEVKELFRKGGSSGIANGNFSVTRDYAEMMTVKRPDSRRMSWLPENCPYPRFWRINSGKEYSATEFMRYRPALYRLVPEGITLLFDNGKWYSRNIQLLSAPVWTEPGERVFRAGFKPEGNVASEVVISYSDMRGARKLFRFYADRADYDEFHNTEKSFVVEKFTCSAPDAAGFRTFEIRFAVKYSGVLRFQVRGKNTTIDPASTGTITWRDVSCEPSR